MLESVSSPSRPCQATTKLPTESITTADCDCVPELALLTVIAVPDGIRSTNR